MLDPLRPYADLLKLLAVLALAGGLFVTGCQRGEDRQSAKDQATLTKADKARAAAEADAAENLRAANACGLLLEDVNRQTQASIDAAALQKAAADEAARQAELAAAESKRRADKAEQALQAAKSKPACRSQLEMALCADIPLL
jgi:mannose-1-phosphate guanylyltransferase